MGIAKDCAKGLERAAKRACRAALRAVLPKPARALGRVDPGAVRRVLVVRQDSRLGNVLLLTPLLRGIREAFPQARTDLLVSDAYGEILRLDPNVDGLLVLPKKMFLPDPLLPPRLLGTLRAASYDLAFDASHMHAFSLTSAVITALAGARRTIGFDRGDAGAFLNDLVPPPAARLHETAILLSLLDHAAPGGARPAARPECHLSREELADGKALWDSWAPGRGGVALFTGARAQKRWPMEHFLELARRCLGAGRGCVLFAGPAEKALIARLQAPPGAVLAPPLPLRRFAAALAAARAVVSADTGPMHLAVAVGAPTVELFLGSEPWRFGYAHLPGHRVIDARGRTADVDEVWAALLGLLDSPGLSA